MTTKDCLCPVNELAADIEYMLRRVQKPGQYAGGESGSVDLTSKASADVRMVFAFPEPYEMGMSHLGMRIIYSIVNSLPWACCERAFMPEADALAIFREKKLPLFGLESRQPVRSCHVLGFSAMHELSYPNILCMLDLAGIPRRSSDRSSSDPIVIAGGVSGCNPEPMSPFVDVFVVGDGEEAIVELLERTRNWTSGEIDRSQLLGQLANCDGFYVPALYETHEGPGGFLGRHPRVSQSGEPLAPVAIRRRYVRDLNALANVDPWLVPYVGIIHDRVILEIMRGCTNGCRFCQAGILYRPRREKSVDKILKEASTALCSSGYDEVSLMSLSSSDHSAIRELAESMVDRFYSSRVAVALPSLRIDRDSIHLMQTLSRVKKTGLTFAPEAGTQRLRDVINKNVTEEDLFRSIGDAVRKGWRKVKLYFMIGLPTETMEDLEGMADLVQRALQRFKVSVNITVSAFVPKSHTPFQWCAMDSLEVLREKLAFLRNALRHPRAKVSLADPLISVVEAILSRGDSRISRLIEEACDGGGILGSFSEHFDFGIWEHAASRSGIDFSEYLAFAVKPGEPTAWNHIHPGVSADFLLSEWNRAVNCEVSIPCGKGVCHGCGMDPADCHRGAADEQ
ncbi:MAG: B12-binding domain-containing radical SAM protein [Candidatus Wallbacteria bacterium HGW-Wallbacteria-1]|uniref:B12-binding domain-containing radical SAM protein n=1 Tax=Candidatus Wallbacteria bacterium HGW-Wallbacteria-1 TaxID=2013854 RepID=A0A2N1PTY0_9BACT|nr:MAG: B12-binding domain-containing radical SAM protein [Candidatus Wallbacteria bacterium HGW-Wallbacteria-1]